MAHSPYWEANSSSFSQKIPRFLWNAKVHYRIHKNPPPLPILSQINSAHAPLRFLKIHFNIILAFMSGSSKWSPSLRSRHQNPVRTSPLPHTCYMPLPSYYSWFYHPNNILRGAHFVKLCSFFHSPLTSSPLGPSILLSTLFRTPQPMFLPQRERPSFTLIKNNKHN